MQTFRGQLARRVRGAGIFAAAAIAWSAVAGNARADDANVVYVEEDWQLRIQDPAPDVQGPQLTCIISPTGDLNGTYSAFDLNHQSLPSFRGGGMQLQVWHGDAPDIAQNPPTNDALWHEGETVAWTQRMAVSDGVLSFQVVNGSSETWGAFGGESLVNALPTTLTNLNNYSPQVSVTGSGIGFASNRVKSLVLQKVRYYSRAGLLREDTTQKTVFARTSSDDDSQ